MSRFDPIPGRDARLPAWAMAFRRAGWSLAGIAHLFDLDPAELRDAGVV